MTTTNNDILFSTKNPYELVFIYTANIPCSCPSQTFGSVFYKKFIILSAIVKPWYGCRPCCDQNPSFVIFSQAHKAVALKNCSNYLMEWHDTATGANSWLDIAIVMK